MVDVFTALESISPLPRLEQATLTPQYPTYLPTTPATHREIDPLTARGLLSIGYVPPPMKKEEMGIRIGEDLTIPFEANALVGVIGGRGSGKTEGCVKPTLCGTWGDTATFVAVDIKGDLCSEHLSANPSSETAVISFREKVEYTIDPLDHVREDGDDNKVANIKEIVYALIPLSVRITDPFWKESPRNLVAAAMIFFYNEGKGFIEIMGEIMSTPPETLIQKIANSGDVEAMARVIPFIKELFIDDEGNKSKEETDKKRYFVNCDSKMSMAIHQEIVNRLEVFNDPRIKRVLVPSEKQVKWTNLDDYNVFISVPEDRLEQYDGVLTMVLTQLFRTLERSPETFPPECTNRKKVGIFLDEFPRLGKMDVITNAASTLRSKGVTMLLVMQSLAQLDLIYGHETSRVIMDNMDFIAIFKITDPESQKYFSDLIGTENDNPKIRPHELRTLKDIVVVTPDDVKRVKKTFHYKTKENFNRSHL
jgi:type IV secretion system protein VirD4